MPADLHDQYRTHFGEAASDAVVSFLKREMVHAAWEVLLDDEFVDAYENGIVRTCADGVTRKIFIRITTYSADYPEK